MTTVKSANGASPQAPTLSMPAAGGRAVARTRPAMPLSALALGLLVASSITGLLVDGVYGESAATASMLRGYDLVTLVVVAPVLAVALLGVRRGSSLAQLVWAGMLAATAYTYAYYVFDAGFNDVFLLHSAVFSAALFALVQALTALDTDGLAARFSPRTPVRPISALLAFLVVGLAGMEVFYAVWFAVTAELPEGSVLVETPSVVHLGYALDLAVLVPTYGLAAVLLWRRRPWGYVLATLALTSGTVHQIGYLVALPFQAAADVPGAVGFDPLELPIAAAFLVGSAWLLAGLRRSPRIPSRSGHRASGGVP
jgi:hypothetical protein